MYILNSRVGTVTEALLRQLIANGETESRRLDFKEMMPGNRDSDKKELLKDVSSFANTDGGVLVFGMSEANGVATEIRGIASNPEQEILRVDQIVLGLQPQVLGCTPQIVPTSDGAVLLYGIPRSLSAPHMVWKYGDGGQFWGRNNSGKYLMDVTEVRRAMLITEQWEQAARQFRDSRVETVIRAAGVPPMSEGLTLLLHLVPLGGPRQRVDLAQIMADWRTKLHPGGGGNYIARPNVDGWMVAITTGRPRHVQIFRSGAFEARFELAARRVQTGEKYVNGVDIDNILATWSSKAFDWIRKAAIEPPYALFVSLLNSLNVSIDGLTNDDGDYAIDRARVDVPEIVFDEVVEDIPAAIRPLLDMIWQAASWTDDPLYQNPSAIARLNILGKSEL